MELLNQTSIAVLPPSQQDTPPVGGTRGVDLAPAAKVVGENPERRRWLLEMLQPDGMSPGSSARAHARAFRFAASLMKAGYRVTEAPLGPRGGRRFTLDSYDGPRSGMVYRLKSERGCLTRHSQPASCTCFDEFSDAQLRLLALLHRRTNRAGGTIYSTTCIADLVRQHGDDRARSAVDAYTRGRAAGLNRPTPTHYANLLLDYRVGELETANQLLATLGDLPDGPTLRDILELASRRDPAALTVAVGLLGRNRMLNGSDPSMDQLLDFVDAVETAVTPAAS